MAQQSLFDIVISDKACRRCGLKKPMSDFYKYRSVCTACTIKRVNKYQKENRHVHRKANATYYKKNADLLRVKSLEWKKANWNKVLASSRKLGLKRRLATMGITIDDLSLAIERQNGVCAICLKTKVSVLGGRHVHVDHCHKSGKFRGVLCSRCNTGLGQFLDDPDSLVRAATYLRENLIRE